MSLTSLSRGPASSAPQPASSTVPSPTAPVGAPTGASTAAATAATTAPPATAPASDRFDGTAPQPARGAAGVLDKLEGLVERRFIRPRDGFVAVEAGRIVGGVGPSAIERDALPFRGPLGALLGIVAGVEHDKRLRFAVDGLAVEGSATGRGEEQHPDLQEGFGAALAARRGLVDVGVTSSDGAEPATAHVLVLPRDYAGPVFVSDIDDTLRETHLRDVIAGNVRAPIDGASALLADVAALGVPIVYLSAGPTRIREQNHAFLQQLPPGILLDNQKTQPGMLLASNAASAAAQADYKTAVLRQLKDTWPQAKIFGLGDDKYGDAIAYSAVGARAFVRDVRPGDDNIPDGFTGVMTSSYDQAFRERVLGELRAAVPPG